MARGENPTIVTRNRVTPPEGMPDPDSVLMIHPGKGYRWISKDARASSEKWGYTFIRDYHPGDELAAKALEDMTPEELRQRADQLSGLADLAEAGRELKPVEKQYLDKEDARAEEEAANAERAAASGLAPAPQQKPRRRAPGRRRATG